MTYLTTRRTLTAALIAGAAYPIARVSSAQQGDHGSHHGGETRMGGMGEMMQCPMNMEGMGMMDMAGMMDAEAAAEEMRAAEEPFDLAFLNAMIPHHLMALMMTEGLIQTAEHPELAGLAQEMFDMQLEEITTMQGWRAAWYSADAATPVS